MVTLTILRSEMADATVGYWPIHIKT